jgi:hypothetical protein
MKLVYSFPVPEQTAEPGVLLVVRSENREQKSRLLPFGGVLD